MLSTVISNFVRSTKRNPKRYNGSLKVLANAQIINGKWVPAQVKGRKLAWMRKQTLMMGREWEDPRIKFKKEKLYSDGTPLPPPNRYGQRFPNKGRKYVMKKYQREQTIAQKMKEMPKLIKAHRQSKKALPETDIDILYNYDPWEELTKN
eukprot:TRINITY_DN13119_c0_g1_i1.p1 TRINITY_DN13119_c0_g1~~TRINITY_DN13119_c0_g1_i1.p1  ORF type:complete len:150 (-),score=46.19 TRINITY_DN13119_c0_g1_i1:69-518(-)